MAYIYIPLQYIPRKCQKCYCSRQQEVTKLLSTANLKLDIYCLWAKLSSLAIPVNWLNKVNLVTHLFTHSFSKEIFIEGILCVNTKIPLRLPSYTIFDYCQSMTVCMMNKINKK